MNRTHILAFAVAAAVATFAQAAPSQLPASNPFAKPSTLPFQYPAFDKIKNEDFAPAFEEGMRQQSAEIDAIAASRAAPTFQNTIGPAAEPRLDRLLQPGRRQQQRHHERAGQGTGAEAGRAQRQDPPEREALQAHQDPVRQA
jgi:hypothetical protein